MKNLINNIEKIHTTELGEIRIRKNLKLAESDDVVAICKEHVKSPDAKIVKDGKNYYVEFAGNLYTINGFNYCIITAKKGKKGDVL